MSLTRTLRSGVKEVRTYEKRQPRKRMKLVLEESATDKADSATSQTDSNVLIESKNTEQNQSNTSLEIFGPADDENLVWVTGEHTNSENVSNGKTLQYGVPLFIQKIFEEYLEMDSTLSAKSLLIKLTKARKLNQKKEEEEKDKKLNFSKHLLPKINQVYIYTLFSPLLIN